MRISCNVAVRRCRRRMRPSTDSTRLYVTTPITLNFFVIADSYSSCRNCDFWYGTEVLNSPPRTSLGWKNKILHHLPRAENINLLFFTCFWRSNKPQIRFLFFILCFLFCPFYFKKENSIIWTFSGFLKKWNSSLWDTPKDRWESSSLKYGSRAGWASSGSSASPGVKVLGLKV